jgi:hypothetical protein
MIGLEINPGILDTSHNRFQNSTTVKRHCSSKTSNMKISKKRKPSTVAVTCCPACKVLFLAGSFTIFFRIFQTAKNMVEYKQQQQQQQQQQSNSHLHAILSASSSDTTKSVSSRSTTQKSLNIHQQVGTSIMLVHIGKAGGSSIRELLQIAIGYCGGMSSKGWEPSEESLLLQSQLHDRTAPLSPLQTHLCALSRVTDIDQSMHLSRNHQLQSQYNHFLVPVRSPLARLTSWFYYERFWMEEAKRRYGKRLHTLVEECGFRTINELFLNGQKGLPTKPTSMSRQCQQMANECITGEYPCFAHNFFNYEFYLEDILRRIQDQNDGAADDLHIPRLDVIRSEHSWDDLNRTLQEWTGIPMTVDMDLLYAVRKPFNVDTTQYNKTISGEAATFACRALCHELIVYKKILQHATNLPKQEKQYSMQQLDQQCGFEVDKVCGTSFEYRNVKKMRKHRLCEPRLPQQANSTLPPC